MKILTSSLLILLSVNSWAQTNNYDRYLGEHYVAVQDNTRVVLPIVHINTELREIGLPPGGSCSANLEQQPEPEKLPGITDSFLTQGAKCDLFIDKEGNYGKYGDAVLNAIRSQTSSARSLLRDDLPTMKDPSVCPKWQSLTKEQREHFWVWTFAAIAYSESRCKEGARVAGVNTMAVGLLQMEEPRRARAWRRGGCDVPSVSDYKNNINCGVTIMETLMKTKRLYLENGRIGSYWQHLNKNKGGPIGSKIREFPLCK